MRLAFVFALVACTPEIPEGRLVCGPSDPCPPGFACRSSGLCYRTGDVDAARVDAGPDASPVACSTDAECEDGDLCTDNECKERACMTTPLEDGRPCGDAESRCCGGACIDPTSDAACGATCEVCELNETCMDGDGCDCRPGFENCDDAIPGCETNIETDPLHCGRCNAPCPSGTPACIGRVCMLCSDAKECDDGLSCTTDECIGGNCVRTPRVGEICTDDDPCTESDVCNAGGTCSGAVRSCADDGNPCTMDVCNRADGTCSTLAVVGPCNDGEACTSGDTCMGLTCMGSPYTCEADDPNPPNNCTSPQCNGTGTCDPIALEDGHPCQNQVGNPRYRCQAGICIDLGSVCCSPGTESGACCAPVPDPVNFAACSGAGWCTRDCCR
jgi:hypothetical protein